MLRTIVFVALVAFATAEKVTFENYKVFRVIPSSQEQLDLLKHLEGLNEGVSNVKRFINTILHLFILVINIY